MKLEGIDPEHQSLFCVMTVAEVQGIDKDYLEIFVEFDCEVFTLTKVIDSDCILMVTRIRTTFG